eukprot:1669190-Amphidinium_carterae.1
MSEGQDQRWRSGTAAEENKVTRTPSAAKAESAMERCSRCLTSKVHDSFPATHATSFGGESKIFRSIITATSTPQSGC